MLDVGFWMLVEGGASRQRSWFLTNIQNPTSNIGSL
jgi:hypothetical protein